MSVELPGSLGARRLTVVVGHSGSGKTEFAVNLAVALAQNGRRTALADLDVVNPYFRSRERRELFDRLGIKLVCTSQACADADLPAMPAELNSVIQDRGLTGILDLGGDPSGARVLARYRPQLLAQEPEVLFVLNANRPSTKTAEAALAYLRGIEEIMGLTVTGIVSNTHLCGETSEKDVLRGAELAGELSRAAGLPVVCHMARAELAGRLPDTIQPVFPVKIFMNKPWEEQTERL